MREMNRTSFSSYGSGAVLTAFLVDKTYMYTGSYGNTALFRARLFESEIHDYLIKSSKSACSFTKTTCHYYKVHYRCNSKNCSSLSAYIPILEKQSFAMNNQ